MLKNASDDELKDLMRSLGKAAGLRLTEERLENDLPQFRIQLGWIETLNAFHLPLESEPGTVMQLEERGASVKP